MDDAIDRVVSFFYTEDWWPRVVVVYARARRSVENTRVARRARDARPRSLGRPVPPGVARVRGDRPTDRAAPVPAFEDDDDDPTRRHRATRASDARVRDEEYVRARSRDDRRGRSRGGVGRRRENDGIGASETDEMRCDATTARDDHRAERGCGGESVDARERGRGVTDDGAMSRPRAGGV